MWGTQKVAKQFKQYLFIWSGGRPHIQPVGFQVISTRVSHGLNGAFEMKYELLRKMYMCSREYFINVKGILRRGVGVDSAFM